MTADAQAVANPLDAAFGRPRPALVCYLPLGDPGAPHADPALYLDCGVDVLEVGVPASDPSLDGPVIAASMRRARAHGMTNERAAARTRDMRERLGNPAVVWLTYASAVAEPRWARLVVESGVHGVLVLGGTRADPPLPPDVHGLGFIPHQPTPADLETAAAASGYVMVAADDGVSGARARLSAANAGLLARVRADGVSAPLALGFGISTAADASAAVACGADGIVVGTAVVAAAAVSAAALRRLLGELRAGLDG